MASSGKRYWHNAQLLRLCASFGIVYIHLEQAILSLGVDFRIFESFRIFTDSFLVLSGFLSVFILSNSTRTGSDFIYGRLSRIVPAYAIFTLAFFVFKNLGMSPENHATTDQLIRSLFFIPHAEGPVLYPTHTLLPIIEFAIFLGIFKSVFPKNGLELSIIFCAILSILGFLVPNEHVVISGYMRDDLMNLALGGTLALVVKSYEHTFYDNSDNLTSLWIATACLFIFAGFSLAIARPFLWPDSIRMIALGGPALLIVSGVMLLDLCGLSWRSKKIDMMCDLAFMVYLSHVFWNIVAEKIGKTMGFEATLFLLLVTPAPVLALSYLANRYIEKPTVMFLDSPRVSFSARSQ